MRSLIAIVSPRRSNASAASCAPPQRLCINAMARVDRRADNTPIRPRQKKGAEFPQPPLSVMRLLIWQQRQQQRVLRQRLERLSWPRQLFSFSWQRAFWWLSFSRPWQQERLALQQQRVQQQQLVQQRRRLQPPRLEQPSHQQQVLQRKTQRQQQRSRRQRREF